MKLALNPVFLVICCGVLLLPQGIVARSLPLPLPVPDTPVQLRHISRSQRDVPSMPMDEHTKHLPCDMDQRGAQSYMTAFPNQCIWAYNNRYRNEGHFKAYRTYQLEAFFFGQYHERLKNYELAAHNYDYH